MDGSRPGRDRDRVAFAGPRNETTAGILGRMGPREWEIRTWTMKRLIGFEGE